MEITFGSNVTLSQTELFAVHRTYENKVWLQLLTPNLLLTSTKWA